MLAATHRLVVWFAKPFVKKKFWKKVSYIPKLMDLYEFFEPKSLVIPQTIIKCGCSCLNLD